MSHSGVPKSLPLNVNTQILMATYVSGHGNSIFTDLVEKQSQVNMYNSMSIY